MTIYLDDKTKQNIIFQKDLVIIHIWHGTFKRVGLWLIFHTLLIIVSGLVVAFVNTEQHDTIICIWSHHTLHVISYNVSLLLSYLLNNIPRKKLKCSGYKINLTWLKYNRYIYVSSIFEV